MTTVYTRSGLNRALTWQEADDNITNLNTDKIEHLVEDLTPQLGGNLDVNTKTITTSEVNGNISLVKNGTGYILVDNVRVGRGKSSGTNNTVLGESAFGSATTGTDNIAIGKSSLNGNTNGNNNIGIGTNALSRNANTGGNVAVGNNALDYAVGGSNTALGHNAGTNLDSGTTNTFIGNSSGSAITGGSYNVILGSNTGSTITGTSNNIIISDGQGNIRISADSTGQVTLSGLKYPITDGTSNQLLKTDGSANIGFTSIKTINNESLLGTGNITVSYTETDPIFVAWDKSTGITITESQISDLQSYLTSSAIGTTVQSYDADLTSWAAIAPSSKQDVLVSGTSIKTLNSTSLLGAGDISVQPILVSGTNIKTINGSTILGSGNITIEGGSGGSVGFETNFLLMGA